MFYAVHIVLITLLLSGTVFASESSNKDVSESNIEDGQNYCIRCHGMMTLAYRDAVTGKLVNLHIPMEAMRDSNHQAILCVGCHTAGFNEYPHPQKAKRETLYCLNCHKDKPKFVPYHFEDIEKEFKQSVHYARLPDHFTCFSCHDAHHFKASRGSTNLSRFKNRNNCLTCHALDNFTMTRDERNISEMIAYNNQICLDCHAVPSRIADLKSEDIPDIDSSHQWLPNLDLHWEHVRCIDCHIAQSDSYLHEIAPASQAVKQCEECHSINSIMTTKLYRYNIQEDRIKLGFVNSVALNEAYIIGMTRNIVLDQVSLIILAITISMLGVHGLARWWFVGRKRP